MKLPTEAELIELENRVLRGWQVRVADGAGWDYEDRIVRTLETLIALARDPSQLLQYLPYDDDALDRAMRPPRKGKLAAVPSVEPKSKKKGKR